MKNILLGVLCIAFFSGCFNSKTLTGCSTSVFSRSHSNDYPICWPLCATLMMSSHSNPQVRYPRLRCQLSDHELVKPACQPIHGQDYRWQMQVPLTSGVRRIESFRGDRYSRIYKGTRCTSVQQGANSYEY